MKIGSRRAHGARVSTLLVLLALALGVAACGGSDDDEASAENSNTPEARVRATHAQFMKSMYAKDAAAVCAAMTRRVQKEVAAGTSCEKQMADGFKYLPLLQDRPRISKVVADGDEYKATVTTGVGSDVLLWFGREDGTWKISAGLHGREAAEQSASRR
jgi:hypothetical protein